jgi:hypothetical protein
VLALQLTLLGAGVLGLIGMGACMVGIAIAAWRLPDLPFSLRLNPLNILMSQDRWTPEIRRLNQAAVRCGFVFLGAGLLFVIVTLLAT